MPIFEYKCQGCGFVEEFLERASTSGKHFCTECGKEMDKMFSTFAPRVASAKPSCAKNPACPNAGCCPNAM